MDTDIIDRVRSAAADCFPRHNVLVAYAYGSRITADPAPTATSTSATI